MFENISHKIKLIFMKQEDKNVWDIISYYVPYSEYKKEVEKSYRVYGSKGVFPPIVKLGSMENQGLRYKSNLQWEQNYLECLILYNKYTGNSAKQIKFCQNLIEDMIKNPQDYQNN